MTSGLSRAGEQGVLFRRSLGFRKKKKEPGPVRGKRRIARRAFGGESSRFTLGHGVERTAAADAGFTTLWSADKVLDQRGRSDSLAHHAPPPLLAESASRRDLSLLPG
jgi:hypothetical protein